MIIELPEEEAFARSSEADMAIPFALTYDEKIGELTVAVYPSLRAQAERFLADFGDAPFSHEAREAAIERFGSFLSENSYLLGEEAEDSFLVYRLSSAPRSAVQETTVRYRGEDARNLTSYMLSLMEKNGYLCYVTKKDGCILSAACTNIPIEEVAPGEELEIGVETAEGFERNGYGRSNVAALSAALAERRCTALYECASQNIASVKLVQSLGATLAARKYYLLGIREPRE